MSINNLKIAIIIPCYNEAAAISKVISDFKKELPNAEIYVFDNNSTDGTKQKALKAGANAYSVKLQGKGNVVRRMFADLTADVYVMVDGDATYHAPSVHNMIDKLTDENLDMVVGCRVEESTNNNNYRPGHRLGNKLLTGSVKNIFGGDLKDMLSGYRVFSKRFAKSFPAESNGFETETELTVHTLEMKIPFGELDTPYRERPEGSESKLSTYKDGVRIIKMILRLYSNERPVQFWGLIGGAFILISLILMMPVFIEYLDTNKVPRFPTVIVASSFVLIGFLSFAIGLILRTVTKGRFESKHLAYLAQPSMLDILKTK